MALPTKAELYAQNLEHLTKLQENCSTIAHLERDTDKLHAQGWLAMSEMFKKITHQMTQLAMKGLKVN